MKPVERKRLPNHELKRDGFAIHRAVFSAEEIGCLRAEASRVSSDAGSSLVRHLRMRSSLIDELSKSPQVLDLLPTGFVPVRSILFDKTPRQNWPVSWHQDLTIAVQKEATCEGYGPWTTKEGVPHVQPPVELLEKMVTARIHLDDTDASNSALMVIPGSHRLGKISGWKSHYSGILTTHNCTVQMTAYPIFLKY